MCAHQFYSHQHSQGALHRWPAGFKLASALAIILTLVMLPRTQIAGLLTVTILLLVSAVAGRINAVFLIRRLLLLESFVLGVIGLALFQPDGWHLFGLLLWKTNLCLLVTVLLSSTTPFTSLLQVLKKLPVPWIFVTTLTLMHRYLHVLADESERMRRARASRTLTRGRRFQWQMLSTVLGQLFIRASERAERIYNSMCARGWKQQ
jgi:cobalt/nickel transport system permease protein